MTDKQTPPDWVLIEAAKRAGEEWEQYAHLHCLYNNKPAYRALCAMIERYEQPPVDRKLLCAREANAETARLPEFWREGRGDACDVVKIALRAIELWEEGFGK